MSIYARLYRYRQTESLSPKENFLTEALADLFNRLSPDKQADFLVDALHASWAEEIRTRCDRTRTIEAQTQVSIAVAGAVKRPDMVIHLDGQPFVVVEVKVDAEVQRHAADVNSDMDDGTPVATTSSDRHQLATYGTWIAGQGRDGWPGAVVFITHSTRAPEGFGSDGRSGPIEVTHSWKDVGDWLSENLDLEQRSNTSCALAADLHDFLTEEDLMPEFMTAQDLAATAVFLPSAANLHHTFKTVLQNVIRSYPGVKSGSIRYEPWPAGNAFCGWFYLASSVNVRGSRFALTAGICFAGESALGDEESDDIPRHEPFFMVHVGDENSRVPITDVLRSIPQDWMLVNEEWSAVAVRTLGNFPPDPNRRAEALIAWVTAQVGHLLAHIRNYQGGPGEDDSNDEE
jgi:hypothetical protein